MDINLEHSIAREVMKLAAQIATTMTRESTGRPVGLGRPKEQALLYFRQRLMILDCGLTDRELDVCARALHGMTAEGTALDLNIKVSTVVTYRKRAYQRLGISSQHELFRSVA